jgi:hypothetical protein
LRGCSSQGLVNFKRVRILSKRAETNGAVLVFLNAHSCYFLTVIELLWQEARGNKEPGSQKLLQAVYGNLVLLKSSFLVKNKTLYANKEINPQSQCKFFVWRHSKNVVRVASDVQLPFKPKNQKKA